MVIFSVKFCIGGLVLFVATSESSQEKRRRGKYLETDRPLSVQVEQRFFFRGDLQLPISSSFSSARNLCAISICLELNLLLEIFPSLLLG